MQELIMMMTTTIITSPEIPRIESTSDEPITTSTFPTWKLYENPFYYSQQPHSHNHQNHQQQDQQQQSHKQLHRLHLPISTRKIAASFWDLTFIKPIMDSELEIAKAQIVELKAELEYERKARKKMESMNKKLARELSEERKGREALKRLCEELAKEIESDKAEVNRMKREIDEERKMLRMAEVFREERVQMKLTEAKLVLEEKILELEVTKQMQIDCSLNSKPESKNQEDVINISEHTPNNSISGEFRFSGEPVRCVSGDNNNGIVNSMAIQRRASPEPENPHIKRGIKGFVEFPKVVRAIGSKSRQLGTKLECQKAQLRILLKQKNPIRSSNLILS